MLLSDDLLLSVKFVEEDDPPSLFPARLSVLQMQLLSFRGYPQHLDSIKLHRRRQRRGTILVLPHVCCCSALHSCKGLRGCEFCFYIEVCFFRGQALTLLFE